MVLFIDSFVRLFAICVMYVGSVDVQNEEDYGNINSLGEKGPTRALSGRAND